MSFTMKNGSFEDSYYVQLMVNLLVRFPEIYTINYNLAKHSCSLSYMIRKVLKGKSYQDLCCNLDQSVQALRYFEKKEPVQMQVHKKNIDSLTCLEIVMIALPPVIEEISLVTNLLREEFPGILVSELRTDEDEWDDLSYWEDISGLMKVRDEQREENLFAFREAGKVYIYDK